MDYYCYLLTNEYNNTYIGITNNLESRLKKHNKILKGGAKSTRKSTNWKYCYITGLFTKSEAGSFEWYWKHYLNKNLKWTRTSTLNQRSQRLQELLSEDKWNKIEMYNI